MGRVGALRIAGGLGYAPGAEPPPDPPPPDATIYGWGENTTGGTGASGPNTHTVDTDAGTELSRGAALKLHINDAATRIISIVGSGNIDLGGDEVQIENGDLTWEGDGWTNGAVKNGWVNLHGDGAGLDNVWLRNLCLWTGDNADEPDDADGLTINGNQAPVTNVLIDHVSGLWGPDIGGFAIFGDVSYVSVLRCISGAGLYRSTHSESSRPGGHAKAFNITVIGDDPADPYPHHISVFLSMIGFASDRNPQLYGAEYLDIANCVFYDWGKNGPNGNPRRMNFERNVVKKGPDFESNAYIFLKGTNKTNPSPHANSIWLGSTATGGTNKAVGFATAVNLAAGTLRSSAQSAIHNYPDIIDATSTSVEDAVFAQAGHQTRRTTETLLLTHMLNGTSDGLYSGASGPAPHPSWP